MNVLFLFLLLQLFHLTSNILSENNEIQTVPKLEYFYPGVFFDKKTNKFIKVARILRRLRLINKNIKKRASLDVHKQNDPYLNLDNFTKSKLQKFFNYFKFKSKKKKTRYPAKVIDSFAFEKYLILDKNPEFSNSTYNDVVLYLEDGTFLLGNSSIQNTTLDKFDALKDMSFYSGTTPGDYSGKFILREPRRPKNLIIALLGVSSDQMYFEAFKYTHYPFISQIKMFGDDFDKDTGIIFPHQYYRKFKPLGSLFSTYRFSWADFAFGFKTRSVNLEQWMYSVESILKLIDYLIQVEKYDPKRVFIYGYSQGGGMALSVGLRSKYVLGGIISTAGFLLERSSKKVLEMTPKITKQGLKIPILLSFCNPDLIFPYRTSKKDVRFLKNVLKANVKYSLVLGENHSCMSKYSMVYIDWIYSIISNYHNSKYKPKKFSYELLDQNTNINDFYNFT